MKGPSTTVPPQHETQQKTMYGGHVYLCAYVFLQSWKLAQQSPLPRLCANIGPGLMTDISDFCGKFEHFNSPKIP